MSKGRADIVSQIYFIFSAAILLLDVYLIISYSEEAADKIGWWKIASAVVIQGVVFSAGVLAIKKILVSRGRGGKQGPSYRNYIPLTILGLALAGLSLSISLLHIGIVCPNKGIPTSRGQSECSSRAR